MSNAYEESYNPEVDYYSVLGISGNEGYNLTAQDIESRFKSSFRRMAATCHPDALANLPNTEREQKEEYFKKYSSAYRALKNPQKKEQYDNARKTHFGQSQDNSHSQKQQQQQTDPIKKFYADCLSAFKSVRNGEESLTEKVVSNVVNNVNYWKKNNDDKCKYAVMALIDSIDKNDGTKNCEGYWRLIRKTMETGPTLYFNTFEKMFDHYMDRPTKHSSLAIKETIAQYNGLLNENQIERLLIKISDYGFIPTAKQQERKERVINTLSQAVAGQPEFAEKAFRPILLELLNNPTNPHVRSAYKTIIAARPQNALTREDYTFAATQINNMHTDANPIITGARRALFNQLQTDPTLSRTPTGSRSNQYQQRRRR